MGEAGSGQTGAPETSLERKISELLALDRSIRNDGNRNNDRQVNDSILLPDPVLGSVGHQSRGDGGALENQRAGGTEVGRRPSLVVEQRDSEQAVAELGLDSPILPPTAESKRMRQAHGREARESSLSTVRKG